MAGCGSCTPDQNPTLIDYPDASTYTVGDAGRLLRGRWNQASFPNVPCPSPQTITWQFYDPGLPGFRGIPQSGTGGPYGLELTSGSNTQSANAGVWYSRNVRYLAAGTYRLRIKMACGATFYSPERTQTVVAASTGAPKVISTPASVI